MKKHFFATALCAVLVLGCFLSCGQSSPVAKESTPAQSTPAPTREEVIHGSAYSTESDALRLRLDYTVKKRADQTVLVDTQLYLEHYSLTVGKRTDGTITVNGKTSTFDTAEIHESENTPHQTLLASRSDTIRKDRSSLASDVQFSARWDFNGVYGIDHTPIPTLTASATVPI